ncbi:MULTISPECIES: SEC-C metal-binding domain-containing protein [unclassified Paenibacillus]|uniref:SEC-C metal-binding domain-containing protein n=1 Tax=unclassified Paenibacillus TaxID=185978 RepID=UPI00104A500B|nr:MULTISPECIES: SEC-C metal-binding domain-containing protein [unclassified Paenibacillus]NIK72065.1 hypothetical protein [Paenibacillus sp. BK720]TCM89831.1 SEC-C motif-containing protein [Paenibacillus sp. BK033]
MSKLGRNEQCHCGSGLKYKKCCMSKDEQSARASKASPAIRHFTEAELVHLVDHESTWANPQYAELAHELIASMKQDYKPNHIAMAIMIWHDFTNMTKPSYRKSGAFCAALEYMVCEVTESGKSKNDLAEKYEVSAATITKRYQELSGFLMQQLEQNEQTPEAVAQ